MCHSAHGSGEKAACFVTAETFSEKKSPKSPGGEGEGGVANEASLKRIVVLVVLSVFFALGAKVS